MTAEELPLTYKLNTIKEKAEEYSCVVPDPVNLYQMRLETSVNGDAIRAEVVYWEDQGISLALSDSRTDWGGVYDDNGNFLGYGDEGVSNINNPEERLEDIVDFVYEEVTGGEWPDNLVEDAAWDDIGPDEIEQFLQEGEE
jgi:hypothetical protein